MAESRTERSRLRARRRARERGPGRPHAPAADQRPRTRPGARHEQNPDTISPRELARTAGQQRGARRGQQRGEQQRPAPAPRSRRARGRRPARTRADRGVAPARAVRAGVGQAGRKQQGRSARSCRRPGNAHGQLEGEAGLAVAQCTVALGEGAGEQAPEGRRAGQRGHHRNQHRSHCENTSGATLRVATPKSRPADALRRVGVVEGRRGARAELALVHERGARVPRHRRGCEQQRGQHKPARTRPGASSAGPFLAAARTPRTLAVTVCDVAPRVT